MADSAARVLVDDIDELRDRAHAIAGDVTGCTARRGNQFAIDHQQPVIVAFHEGFHDDRARMFARHVETLRYLRIGGEADGNSAAVIAVVGLGHHRKADALAGAHRLALGLHQLLLRHRQAERGEDLVGLFLVAGELDGDVRRAAGDRGLDALLVLAVAELHQRLIVQPQPGNVALLRGAHQRRGRRPQRAALREADELIARRRPLPALRYAVRRAYRLGQQRAQQSQAQLAGGNARLKTWILDEGKTFIQVPFPDGYKNENTSFELFLSTLEDKGIKPAEIAGVMTESYQGVGPDFLPVEYAKKLEAFCLENDIVTIFDEVQAGFGRTGKMFCYEHYGIKPDLIACGKGISSSLPISAVIGRKDIMSLYAPGSMTSTHSGSPLPVVAAIESLKIILKEKLVEKAAILGEILIPELTRIRNKYPDILGCIQGKGLVAGIQVVKEGTKIPDSEMALKINERCFHKGLLMFAPVGIAGECLKIAPPLVISEEALREGIKVFGEACDEILG